MRSIRASRFAWLTESYWGALPGNIHESSVHLGLVTIALALYCVLRAAYSVRNPRAW